MAFRLAFVGIDHPHGPGWRRQVPHLGDAVEVVAYVPRFDGATASLEEWLEDRPRFETVAELIEWGMFDGALVCVPNNECPQAVLALVEAKKHVLVEKPGCGRADDFRPVVEAVQEHGVAFQSGYLWRYAEAPQRLRRMVADGRFGKLISLEMSMHTSDVARRDPSHYLFDREISGGGFFNWLACHWIDLMFYVTQRKAVGVTAKVSCFGNVPIDMEDGGSAIIELDDGSLVTLVGGYWLPRWSGESHWSLRGSRRWVHWKPAQAGTGGVLEIHGPQPQWDPMDETYVLPADENTAYGGTAGLELMRDWIRAAKAGNSPCRNRPATTLATLELIDAIYESSAQGKRISCAIGADASSGSR